MLARDIRRAKRRKAGQKAARRRHEELSKKWRACPNSGLTAKEGELVRKNVRTEPLEIVGSADAPRLVCYHCKSVWRTQTAFTHPPENPRNREDPRPAQP